MEEAPKTHLDQDVIAHDSTRGDPLCEGLGPTGDCLACGVAAARLADVDRLADLEGPVLQGHSVAPHRLLDAHGAIADRTGLRRFARADEYTSHAEHPTTSLCMERRDVLPQCRERLDRDRAPFFSMP